MFLKATCTSLLGAFAVVSAVKDDEYYRAGMGNPNVDLKMYWADAHNVLEDLDQFQYLYVQYHNCAWAQNKATYEDQESGSGDENDYWYLDATPTYAANVAFSLYGALEGEKFEGCTADTFINSFTTNQGFEKFAAAMYYAGAVDTDYSQSYYSACQGGAGVVCDYQYGFAYATFSTDTCDPAYTTSVTDSMPYMNQAFQSAQCVQIYDKSTWVDNSYNYNNDDNNNRDLQEQENKEGKDAENQNGDRALEDANNNYNANGYGYGNYGYNGYAGYANSGYGYNAYANNYYTYYGTPLSLLYYSNACFVQNYWSIDSGCPDPFGVLSEYQANFNKGVRKSAKIDTYATYRANMETGKRYVKIGAFLFFSAVAMFLTEQLMAFKEKKAARGIKSGPSSKSRKSVVELVSTTGVKIKKSASKGVKKAVAKVTKSKKPAADKDADGIMVDPPAPTQK